MELVNINDLHKIYKEIESQSDLFKTSNELLQIPVNLNIFRTTRNVLRTNYLLNYEYRDHYSFQDSTFIYNYKTGFQKPKSSNIFLKNLTRHNKQTFPRSYQSDLAIQSHQHVNWMDNGYGLKLSNILNVEPFHITPFSPSEKYVSLKYDHIHPYRTQWFYFYTNPKEKNKNIHSNIEFGKLKNKYLNASQIFPKNTSINTSFCTEKQKPHNLTPSQSQMINLEEEGYDGVCDHIDIKKLGHPAFKGNTSQKWSTPYSAYRFKYSSKTWRKEYYHYQLGEYVNDYGKSKNLMFKPGNKNLWFVDYDNIFKLQLDEDGLYISIDGSKISKNHHDFLKVSSLFDFEFTYKDQDDSKTLVYDMKKILSNQARIPANLNSTLFSDFYVSIKLKRGKQNVELMNDLEKYKYVVNSEVVKNSDMWLDHIFVSHQGIEEYMPSQFLDDELLAQHVYFSSDKSRKFKFSTFNVEDLKVFREFNDETGVLKIRYYDFMEKLYKDIYWSGMKKIPTDGKIRIMANNMEEAMAELKKRIRLPEYFWNNVELIPSKHDNVFEEYREYQLFPKHLDPIVRKQWGQISAEIFILNEKDISPTPLELDNQKINKNMNTWFNFNEESKKDINMSDYSFKKVKEDKENIHVEVSLNSKKAKGHKKYVFKVPEHKNLDNLQKSSTQKEQPEKTILDQMKGSTSGIGYLLLGGGFTSIAAKIFGFTKRRF